MAINPTSSVGATTAGAATAGQGTDGLNRDAFLKLLVTQLQHQDPMSPMENGEFIAQLATFSSLEQLTTISSQVSAITQFLAAQNVTPSSPSSNTSPQPSNGGQ